MDYVLLTVYIYEYSQLYIHLSDLFFTIFTNICHYSGYSNVYV